MHFDFDEEQRLLAAALREFLEREHPPERIRGLWQTETGCSDGLWSQLAALGVPGALAPEAAGGLGLDEIDAVLLMEEAGRAALAEPLVATAAVGVPLLRELGGALAERWLPPIASGDARLAVGHAQSPFVADAHVADLLLLPHGDELHALAPDAVRATREPANDPSHRLFSVAWTRSPASRVASGAGGRALQEAAFDRGALATAAQQLGVADRLIGLAVAYARERRQFGVPIGSFQAVKHQLADVRVALEYARSLVYRAAHSVARDAHTRATDVSLGKAAAGDAALRAARTALQVHGAIGYTWEQDVHIWMRRAWSLDQDFGTGDWHRARVADAVIDGTAPAESFGYRAPL